MKGVVFFLFWLFGGAWLCRYLNRTNLTIVLYHSVPSGAPFEAQMRYLAGRYTILPLDEAVRRLQDGTLPLYPLSITFDDGYRDNYTRAYPILKKYDMHATFFLSTDFVFKKQPLWVDRLKNAVGTTGIYWALRRDLKRLPEDEKNRRLTDIEQKAEAHFADFTDTRSAYAPLELADIAQMQKSGMAFGAHTQTHPILSNVPIEQAKREIQNSRDTVLQAFGSLSELFCYPNGQAGNWTEAVERIVTDSGFKGAVTTIEGVNTRTTNKLRLKRITLAGDEPIPEFAIAVSGLRARLRNLVRG